MMMKMTLMIMTLACVGADDEKVDNDDNDENKDDKKNGYDASAWPQWVVMTRMTIRRITMILMTLMILTLVRVGADGKQIMRRSVQEASLPVCSYAGVPSEWPCSYSLVMPMHVPRVYPCSYSVVMPKLYETHCSYAKPNHTYANPLSLLSPFSSI